MSKLILPRIYFKRLLFIGEDIFRIIKGSISAVINKLYRRSSLSDQDVTSQDLETNERVHQSTPSPEPQTAPPTQEQNS
ncbi:hypothetical protein ACFL0Y_01685 [Patescibacteria group bacterium]